MRELLKILDRGFGIPVASLDDIPWDRESGGHLQITREHQPVAGGSHYLDVVFVDGQRLHRWGGLRARP